MRKMVREIKGLKFRESQFIKPDEAHQIKYDTENLYYLLSKVHLIDEVMQSYEYNTDSRNRKTRKILGEPKISELLQEYRDYMKSLTSV